MLIINLHEFLYDLFSAHLFKCTGRAIALAASALAVAVAAVVAAVVAAWTKC